MVNHTFGGSVVILMPAWRMEMGNSGLGLLLSHSRKSGWGCGSSDWICSTCLSSCGIQLSDRWQLARNTQLPCHTHGTRSVLTIQVLPCTEHMTAEQNMSPLQCTAARWIPQRPTIWTLASSLMTWHQNQRQGIRTICPSILIVSRWGELLMHWLEGVS